MGNLFVVVISLYGLRGCGSAWEEGIQKVTRDLGFQPCMNDADVWTRSAVDTSAI